MTDNYTLTIRNLDPSKDYGLILAFYRSLSNSSLRSRFMGEVKDVDDLVRFLMDEKPIVYAAYVNGTLAALGEAYQRGDKSFEVALVVKDEYQGRGIGKSLFKHMLSDLFEARGASRVYVYVSSDNLAMVNICMSYGGRVIADDPYLIIFENVKAGINNGIKAVDVMSAKLLAITN